MTEKADQTAQISAADTSAISADKPKHVYQGSKVNKS